MDNNRRLLLAGVLFLAFVIGYQFVRNRFFPAQQLPAAPAKADPALVKAVERDLGRWLAAAPAPALPLPNLDEVQAKLDAERRDAEKKKADAIAAERAAAQPDKDITLGDDSYKMKAVFSEAGGAVRKIIFTGYKAATRDEALPLNQPLILLDDDDDGLLAGLAPDKKLERQSFRFLVEGADIRWTVREHGIDKVVFAADLEAKKVRVIRTFTLKPGQYHLEMSIQLEALPGAGKTDLVYDLTGPRGINVEGLAWKTSAYRQVALGAVAPNSGKFSRQLLDPYSINPANPKRPVVPNFVDPASPLELQYAGLMTQYFAAVVVVNGDPTQARFIEKVTPQYLGDDVDFPNKATKLQGRISVDLSSRPVRLEANKPVEHQYLLYTGPAKVRLLAYAPDSVDESLVRYYGKDLRLETLTDYHWDNFVSNWIFAPLGFSALIIYFTNIMHWLLESLHGIIGSYGIAIILMTVIVRGLMFPISRKQAVMGQRQQQKMAAVKPELDKIKEKFKNDPQQLQRAQMDLYRKHGLLNPLNAGCLVVFLQMPVFMGLYYALYESVHLRLATFLWIENLAAPDMLIRWGQWGNFLFLNFGPFFNILPIVSVTLMAAVQKMMTPPAMDEQQAMQQKMMTVMTFVMGYMFYWVPAGLCIYFIVSSTWGMLERKLLPKRTATTMPSAQGKPGGQPERAAKNRPSKNGAEDGVWGKLKDQWQQLLDQAKKK